MNMNQKRLGDIASYINGYPFKPEDRGTVGLPIIRIQDLTGNAYDLGFYDGDYPERIEINDGDVLISWSASLGVYVWDRGKALLNQHIFKVVFDKAPVNKQFFVYAVQHKLREMESKTHGATMKHIVKKDFDDTTIPFPSMEQQAEIAGTLSKVAGIVSARQQQLSALDDLIKARFVEMSSRWEREMRRTPLYNYIKFITYGFTNPMPDADIGPWKITAKDIINGVVNYATARRTTQESYDLLTEKCKPVKGDVLLTKDGTLGRLAVVDQDGICVNQSVAVLRPNERILPAFLMALLNSPECQREMIANSGGGTIKHLYITKVDKMEVVVPRLDEQEEFISFVSQINKSKSVIQKSLDETQLLFDSLMQKYFG